MAKGLQPLSVQDLENLESDDKGHLYWKGKKLKAGGLSTTEIISLVGVIVALLGVVGLSLANLEKIVTNVSYGWSLMDGSDSANQEPEGETQADTQEPAKNGVPTQ